VSAVVADACPKRQKAPSSDAWRTGPFVVLRSRAAEVANDVVQRLLDNDSTAGVAYRNAEQDSSIEVMKQGRCKGSLRMASSPRM